MKIQHVPERVHSGAKFGVEGDTHGDLEGAPSCAGQFKRRRTNGDIALLEGGMQPVLYVAHVVADLALLTFCQADEHGPLVLVHRVRHRLAWGPVLLLQRPVFIADLESHLPGLPLEGRNCHVLRTSWSCSWYQSCGSFQLVNARQKSSRQIGTAIRSNLGNRVSGSLTAHSVHFGQLQRLRYSVGVGDDAELIRLLHVTNHKLQSGLHQLQFCPLHGARPVNNCGH
mmetsp:Transcript_56434/g.92789  ORF Transcript_56434/g.92789 Transcript_56434/m.92789 type:complete len:227 (-) Transcript_56434:176-856(-)